MLTKLVGGLAFLTMLALHISCDKPAPPSAGNPASAGRYVAQEDAKASDDNDGSEAAPWKTIARSLKTLKPGDTVFVKKGVYREEIVLTRKTLGANENAALLETLQGQYLCQGLDGQLAAGVLRRQSPPADRRNDDREHRAQLSELLGQKGRRA
jgi:hypothetical protein